MLYFAAGAFFIDSHLMRSDNWAIEFTRIGFTCVALRLGISLITRIIMFDHQKYARENVKNAKIKENLDTSLAKVHIKKDQIIYSKYLEILNEIKKNDKKIRIEEKTNIVSEFSPSSPIPNNSKEKKINEDDQKWKKWMKIKKWIASGTGLLFVTALGITEMFVTIKLSDEDTMKLNMLAIPWAIYEFGILFLKSQALWITMKIIQKWRLYGFLGFFEWFIRMFGISLY